MMRRKTRFCDEGENSISEFEGTKRAQTGGEGEYQNWRELLGKNSASPENSHKKIHATPVQMDHP